MYLNFLLKNFYIAHDFFKQIFWSFFTIYQWICVCILTHRRSFRRSKASITGVRDDKKNSVCRLREYTYVLSAYFSRVKSYRTGLIRSRNIKRFLYLWMVAVKENPRIINYPVTVINAHFLWTRCHVSNQYRVNVYFCRYPSWVTP